MWIYLWDIVDEGYDAVFSFLKERGLTAVSLASAYHAGKFLSPHNPKRKVVFLDDGTVYFKPDAARFGAITPAVNRLVDEGHHIGTVKLHAERFGLETRAWVVCCHNSRIGTEHPTACTETAFGDKLVHNLCPNNQDVRRYLRGVVESLAAQEIRTIELEALQFQGYSHGMHHEREGIPLPLAVRALMGLCFCPSCVRSARGSHVDIDAVRMWTLRTLERYFADPASLASSAATLEMLPGDLFGPFEQWREDCVRDTAAELADAVAPFGTVLRPMTSLDPIAQRLTAMNPAKVAQATGGMLALGYMKDGNALRAPLRALKEAMGAHQLTVGMHVGMPESGGKNEFLDRVAASRALGITHFNFYNYGFVPLAYLDWIPIALA
jgi:hypothetical protein